MSENDNNIDVDLNGNSKAAEPVQTGDTPEANMAGETKFTESGAEETEVPAADVEPAGSTRSHADQYTYSGQPYAPFTGQYQYQQQNMPPQYGYGKPAQPFYAPPQYNQPAHYGQEPPPPPAKGRKKGIKVFFSILSVLLVFALVVSGFAIGRHTVSKSGTDATTTTSGGPSLNINNTPDTSAQISETGVLTPVEVAAKVKPSVVGILVYSNQKTFSSSSSDTATGEGSGIVMGADASGEYTYIITCAHVVSDSGVSISIQLENGTQQKAELVGYDLRTDVGVIKVKMSGLTAAVFGDSSALKVGEQVFAVGNPGGTEFYGSFTAGMVSAIDRPVDSEIGYTMECIQHDAAINPGNSGGALVNIYGQVIGINSLKIADTSYEGMGFAIPITSAKSIVDSIIQYGYVPNRPKLGITYYAASSSQVYSMIVQIKGLPGGSLYINEINSDSSLANTEAKKGDLIIAVNSKKLDTAKVLLEIIDNGKVGDTITLTLCRVSNNYQTSEFDVKVTLVEDKGTTSSASAAATTTNPFDYFNNPWG